jgi:hypothetical protein
MFFVPMGIHLVFLMMTCPKKYGVKFIELYVWVLVHASWTDTHDQELTLVHWYSSEDNNN